MSSLLHWFAPEYASLFPEMMLLLIIALIISSLGFYRTVYFISIGYAFSIVAMAVITPLRHIDTLHWYGVLQNALLVLWGLRLGIFLVRREYQASYGKELKGVRDRSAGMAWWTKLLVWVSVSILYVLMYSPALFNSVTTLGSGSTFSDLFIFLGLFVMVFGLVLEGWADRVKSNFKAKQPDRYCDAGVYQWVRCPNYLGEITFWVGNWIVGIAFYNSPMKWVAGLIGLICIVLIMIGSTKRLEKAQTERYGALPKYQQFIHTVPVLFPFVPVYSLKNVRVYLE